MDDKSAYKLWALSQFRAAYCNAAGQFTQPFRLDEFETDLHKKQPPNGTAFRDICEDLDMDILSLMCDGFSVDEHGCFASSGNVILALRHLRPDLAEKMMVGQIVAKLEKNMQEAKPSMSSETITQPPRPPSPPALTHGSATPVSSSKSQLSSSQISLPAATSLPSKTEPMSIPRDTQSGVPSTEFTFTFNHTNTNKKNVSAPLSAKDTAELFVLAQLECDKHTWTAADRLQTQQKVVSALLLRRPDIHRSFVENAILKANATRRLRAEKLAAVGPRTATGLPPKYSDTTIKPPGPRPNITEAWVYQQYLLYGFGAMGFMGYPKLAQHIRGALPDGSKDTALAILSKLRKSGKLNVQRDAPASARARRAQQEQEALQEVTPNSSRLESFQPYYEVPKRSPGKTFYADGFEPSTPLTTTTPAVTADQTHRARPILPPTSNYPKHDLIARKREHSQATEVPSDVDAAEATLVPTVEGQTMDLLLAEESDESHKGATNEMDSETRYAPLIAANIITEGSQNIVPQYGLLGSYKREKMFLNTNIPFSAFVCGVQGSGKSHTTACILENALISSPQLGRLQRPLSALVFHYGQSGGDSSDFSVSEAAFLAASHPAFPTHPHVKRINVLVSPSNYVSMARLYSRIPNVAVSPFKLKASSLDVDIMITLMNSSESDEQPLYTAAVTQILRQMTTDGGAFNYLTFKGRLQQCRFNPTQVNMLQMRLDLLESFLDLNNTRAESQFQDGEVTIMDMSCPFVNANTACTLFRIGLQKYLQSGATGKMIVLDEAHKYMLPSASANALSETLLTTIRLQRHYGVRIIVSAQEPTLLTDLIALCSVTVIHRFSSPEWFAAIKRHIPMNADEHHVIARAIESLKTGSALVYSPNAILGRLDDGMLIKGTGKLLKLNIRKRVTSDGGQSVFAV